MSDPQPTSAQTQSIFGRRSAAVGSNLKFAPRAATLSRFSAEGEQNLARLLADFWLTPPPLLRDRLSGVGSGTHGDGHRPANLGVAGTFGRPHGEADSP